MYYYLCVKINSMIINEFSQVGISGSNMKWLMSKGYIMPTTTDKRGRVSVKKGTKISVKTIDLLPKTSVEVQVMCEDCGEIRTIQYNTLAGRKNSQYLKTGETLCSKCANTRMSGINSHVYKHGNILYPQYRNNAKRRGIEFDLSVKEFETLIPGNCNYCGEKSNGIDRVYSDIGYKIENCVPCCAQCNFIKNNTPPDLFIKKIVNMYNTFKKNGLI